MRIFQNLHKSPTTNQSKTKFILEPQTARIQRKKRPLYSY